MNDLEKIEIVDSIEEIDWGVQSINAPQVWHKTMGEGVKIATIDTGVDVNHPNLKGKITSVFNMIEKSFDVTDEYGHGTHVAGLLVGEMTGVAPKSELHVMKVLNGEGVGMVTHVMDGITNAINLEVDILSISLGVPYDLPLILKQRIREAYEAGITIVSATGNSGLPTPQYPAFMDEVIAIGGLDKELNEASFSNGGYDVLAPSIDILSTFKNGQFARMNGTSMASPLVAGAIALVISHYKKQGRKLSPSEIKQMVKGKIDLTKLID